MKEGFIYIWYDRKRRMYYIGSHWGTINDSYICSSNRMRDAHRRRPHDFKRRVIKKGIEKTQLLDEEHKWLSLISDEQLGKKYYNLRKHRFSHWTTDENNILTIAEKISVKNKGRKYPNRKSPPPFTEEHLRKMSERMMGNSFGSGYKHTEEWKKKMSKKRKGKKLSEEHINKIKEARSKQIITEETKRKISETQKGRILSEETRKKMSLAKKGRPRVPGSGRTKRYNQHIVQQ